MSLWQLVVSGALRNRLRFVLTVLGVAAVIAGFVLVRTVSDVWQLAVQSAAQDRLLVSSTSEAPIPVEYAERIAKLDPEFSQVSPRWALDIALAGKRAHRVLVQRSEDAAAGEIVVAVKTAQALGWSANDVVHVHKGPELRVVIKDVATTSMRSDLPTCQDLVVSVTSPALAPILAKKIDAAFAQDKVPTITQSEHENATRSAQALSGLFSVIDLVSATLLLVLGFVVAGMIVFSTDERTTEYAVLRALGFSPALVGVCVSGEALLMAVTGAALGLIGGVLGAFVIQWASQFAGAVLPAAFTVTATTLLLGFLAATSLALVASLIPAIRASRVAVAHELRRQG